MRKYKKNINIYENNFYRNRHIVRPFNWPPTYNSYRTNVLTSNNSNFLNDLKSGDALIRCQEFVLLILFAYHILHIDELNFILFSSDSWNLKVDRRRLNILSIWLDYYYLRGPLQCHFIVSRLIRIKIIYLVLYFSSQ